MNDDWVTMVERLTFTDPEQLAADIQAIKDARRRSWAKGATWVLA